MTPDEWLALVPATYRDASREVRTIRPEVREAVLAAMGLAPDDPVDPTAGVAIVRPSARLPTPGEVMLEDGTSLGRLDRLPDDCPLGYHRLRRDDDGDEQLLITGPGRCHLPPDLREWGWAVQLAATRSRRSWGIGDLCDLRDLAAWSADAGAGFVVVSPLGAQNPGPDPEPSPYYPSTRRFGNPLHLCVDEVPGADGSSAAGRALNADRRIGRAEVQAIKLAALERAFSTGVEREAFDFMACRPGPRTRTMGDVLCPGRAVRARRLALVAAGVPLARRAGSGQLRRPVGGPSRVPCLAAVVLRSAGGGRIGSVAPDRRHAGRCRSRRVRRLGLAGAAGQRGDGRRAAGSVQPGRAGLVDAAVHPAPPGRGRLRPFIDTVRAQLRHAGGLRIDHVLGLFRLWWIPSGSEPADGAYVRYPTRELLEIVALESCRAEALVIGEDLGTVPPGVRDELRRRRLLSTRLVLFERQPPARYPRGAFAAITTHDLPTVAGALTGSDLTDQAAAGVVPDADGLALLRARLLRAAQVADDSASPQAVATALHAQLGGSPAALVAATLEDALGVAERPNLPGTVASQRDNWSLALPVPIEGLATDPGIAATVAALRR